MMVNNAMAVAVHIDLRGLKLDKLNWRLCPRRNLGDPTGLSRPLLDESLLLSRW